MSDRRTVILVGDRQRQTAHAYVDDEACTGWLMTLQPALKRRIQEERYHAMIGDIAKQCEFMGRRWDADDWKRLLIDAFAEAMRAAGTPLHHDGRVVPSLDGQRVVQLGIQSRDFWVKEASEFIEYLFSYGAEHSVAWSEPKTAAAEPA